MQAQQLVAEARNSIINAPAHLSHSNLRASTGAHSFTLLILALAVRSAEVRTRSTQDAGSTAGRGSQEHRQDRTRLHPDYRKALHPRCLATVLTALAVTVGL